MMRTYEKIAAALICMMLGANAQTNLPPRRILSIQTNWVWAADEFRKVNGRIYNTEKSGLWGPFDVHVMAVVGKKVICDDGKIDGRVLADYERVVIQNFPMDPMPVVGREIQGTAMRIGADNSYIPSAPYALYDCGTNYGAWVITTNYAPRIPK